MELIGKIKVLNETQSIGTNGFQKREIVITTDEQYPQHILVEFTQDKCELLDNFSPDQDVKISINFKGREWVNPKGESVYFNTIQGWRIELYNGQNSVLNNTTTKDPVTYIEAEDDDVLPF